MLVVYRKTSRYKKKWSLWTVGLFNMAPRNRSIFRSSVEQYANVVVRTRSICATITIKSSLPGSSDVILFSRTSAVAVLTVNVESKERFFFAFGREREGKSGRCCKKCRLLVTLAGGRLAECILKGRLSVHEKAVAKSR